MCLSPLAYRAKKTKRERDTPIDDHVKSALLYKNGPACNLSSIVVTISELATQAGLANVNGAIRPTAINIKVNQQYPHGNVYLQCLGNDTD